MWLEEEGVQLVSAAGELQQGSGSWLRAGPGQSGSAVGRDMK